MSTVITVSVVALLLGLVLFAEFIFRARRPRSWVVDHAGTLEELERRLNHLDEQGFRLYEILPDGAAEAAFVMVAFRPFSRWRLR